MKSLGNILKVAREEKEMILRKVSAEVDIDQSLISKFEKNERKPTKEQVIRLAEFYNLSEKELNHKLVFRKNSRRFKIYTINN